MSLSECFYLQIRVDDNVTDDGTSITSELSISARADDVEYHQMSGNITSNTDMVSNSQSNTIYSATQTALANEMEIHTFIQNKVQATDLSDFIKTSPNQLPEETILKAGISSYRVNKEEVLEATNEEDIIPSSTFGTSDDNDQSSFDPTLTTSTEEVDNADGDNNLAAEGSNSLAADGDNSLAADVGNSLAADVGNSLAADGGNSLGRVLLISLGGGEDELFVANAAHLLITSGHQVTVVLYGSGREVLFPSQAKVRIIITKIIIVITYFILPEVVQ